jgi:hypothetical protein
VQRGKRPDSLPPRGHTFSVRSIRFMASSTFSRLLKALRRA